MSKKLHFELDAHVVEKIEELQSEFRYMSKAEKLHRQNYIQTNLVDVDAEIILRPSQKFRLLDLLDIWDLVMKDVEFRPASHEVSLRIDVPSGLFLRAILPPEDAEDRIANLEHWFHTVWCKKHSRTVARVLFHCQIVRTIIAYYADKWKSWVELLLPKRG